MAADFGPGVPQLRCAMAPNPRLPIKLDATSNGEFAPQPLPRRLVAANRLAAQRIADHARRVGRSRRDFLASLCGAATTLLTLNAANAAAGRTGGAFRVHPEAAFDQAAAADSLADAAFIFDVQTHMVNPAGAWRRNRGQYWERILARFPQGKCGEADPVDCYTAERFVEAVFVDSDTDLAVLSFVPETPDGNPLDLEEANRTRALVAALDDGAHRLLLHAMVVANLKPYAAQHRRMRDVAAAWPIAAWKVYTQWGPEGTGWWLDDPEVGIPFIETARAIGIRRICIHKGLSFGGMPREYASCVDVGRVARRYPDVDFIIYHSGYEVRRPEGPYDPKDAASGVDSLVKSLQDNGIAPDANVYAELGSTWRHVMRDPTMAVHTLGKLLRHVGEDNVLWGTDSIWYGTPQDQIQRSAPSRSPTR
jgi:hypothetical protein